MKTKKKFFYKGTNTTCTLLHMIGNKAWVATDDNLEGHLIDLDMLTPVPHGGRSKEDKGIKVDITLYFNSVEAANTYEEFILLENDMITFINDEWLDAGIVLDFKDVEQMKFNLNIGRDLDIIEDYSYTYYSFIALPSSESRFKFRKVFTDEQIVKVLRRPL